MITRKWAPLELAIIVQQQIDNGLKITELADRTGLRPHWIELARHDDLEMGEITQWHIALLAAHLYPQLPIIQANRRTAQECGLNFDELPTGQLIAA